ncbi:MAG TPA: VOC family protein [Actinomycetota bacterium]|jgi:predicted enzyme related to lactoylglutathione lyase
MPTRFQHVVVDAADPAALARWWAGALGWAVTAVEPEEVVVEPPEPDGVGVPLVFVPVPDPKVGKNRVHLDLRSASADDQAARVARLTGLGARPADIGQGEVPWVVLADPEGNEFCVLDPRDHYADTGAVAAVVVDSSDPRRLAGFWTEATAWPLVRSGEGFASLASPSGAGPYLEFVEVHEPKLVKNRLHVDVAPYPDDDLAAEVARLRSLGAAPADVGQHDVPWVVLADPEGNEFCVLTPR